MLSYENEFGTNSKNAIFVLAQSNFPKATITMTATQLEKELIRQSKGLSKDVLREIIDFIQFLRQKKLTNPVDNIIKEQSEVSISQTIHLEKEFKDYKQIYPNE